MPKTKTTIRKRSTPKKPSRRSKSTLTRSYNDRRVIGAFHKLPFGVLMAIAIIFAGLLGYAYVKDIGNSSAAILKSSNFDDGSIGWSTQRVSSDRIRVVSQADNGVAPAQGSRALRFEVRSGDNPLAQWCCVGTERAELTSSTNETKGTDRWYSWYQMFDPTYPSYVTYPTNQRDGWQIFAQWHGNDSVSPPLAFFAAEDKIALATGNGNSYIEHWRGNMNKGQWNHIKMHIVWGDSGTIELWYNGVKVLTKTGVDNVTNPPLYLKMGLYRKAMSRTAITYMDDFKMATSEADLGGSTTPAPAPTPTPTPSPAPTAQSPYGGSARSIPGVLQAEDYDNGGQNVAYYDFDTSNNGGAYRTNLAVDVESCREGGYNVGWTREGEWLEYTTNITAGTYTIGARAGSYGGGSLRIKVDGTTVGTIPIPNTSGWQAYQTGSISGITLPGGSNRVVRLEVVGASYTLNWVSFTLAATSAPPPAAPSPQPGTPSQPSTSPQPSQPQQPVTGTDPTKLPVVTVSGANPANPVKIPTSLPVTGDGSFTADFNGDGINDIATDANQDGFIDPNSELLIDSAQVDISATIPNGAKNGSAWTIAAITGGIIGVAIFLQYVRTRQWYRILKSNLHRQ